MAIQSVQRALTILTLFSDEQPLMGITEISRLMTLPKPTIHGLVQTLADEGFLVQDSETRKYSLGLKIYELGVFLSGTLRVNQIGGPTAQRLSKSTGLMVRIAIWERDMILVTLNLFPTVDETVLFRQLGLGPSVPAYSSAVGKAILSTLSPNKVAEYLDRTELTPFTPATITSAKKLKEELAAIKETGFAIEREEYLNGLACISVPIFNATGASTAAISISGTTDFLKDPRLPQIKAELKQTANEISIGMGCPASRLYK